MDRKTSIPEITKAIREEAMRLGFADCGFSKAGPLPGDSKKLQQWLKSGFNAGMGYMANHFEKRSDPTQLVDGARSVISLLLNYFTRRIQEDPEAPVISKYAYGLDYHFVMKEKMQRLFEFIRTIRPGVSGRVFVDSAPVFDRAWAREGGLGWIGKNSNLISREAGSFVFIGEIILDLELEYNAVPENDYCGSCTACIEACPTQAILDNRTLDSRRCISYQTIENRREIDPDLEGDLANRLFGCDICQDVCPWNRKARQHREPEFEPAPGLMEMSRESWDNLDSGTFNRLFRNSAVKRAGYAKLKDTIAFLHPGAEKGPGSPE